MNKRNIKRSIISLLITAALIFSSFTLPSYVSNAAVRVKSITLNKSKLVLHEGEKTKIKVIKVKPKRAKKAVTYKSNKKSVASVTKNGVVSAKSEGTAKITVASKNNKKIKKIVKVTVVKGMSDNVQIKPDITIQTPAPTGKPSQSPDTKPTISPTANPAQTDESSYPQKVLELVNNERASQGLNALVLDSELCKAASVRANELVTSFSHTRPDGTTCFTVLNQLGISYRATGENIANGYRTPEQVMNGWMNSEGHRANILTPNFGKLGVGYLKTSSGVYWVQLFTN